MLHNVLILTFLLQHSCQTTFLGNHKPGNVPVAMSVNQSMPRSGGYAAPAVRPVIHPPVRPSLQRVAGAGNALRQGMLAVAGRLIHHGGVICVTHPDT